MSFLDKAGNTLNEAKHRIEEGADKAKTTVGDVTDDVKEKAYETKGRIEERENN